MKTPTTESVNCPKKACGALFDVTPRIAFALGNKHVKCDKCGDTWVLKVAPEVSR